MNNHDKNKDEYVALKKYNNRDREYLHENIPGAIYKVELDNTHPLAYGYDNLYYTLKQDANIYEFLKEGWNVGVLKKDNYEIIQEKIFSKQTSKDSNLGMLEMLKDIDSLSLTDFFSVKIENKLIVYRKSKESKLSIIVQTDKNEFKTSQVVDMSRVILSILEKRYFSENLSKQHVIDLNLKDIFFGSIEELTVNFLEYLRKNKLFARFIYFNYNPSVSGAFTYKKVKQDSASIILNNRNDEKLIDMKDTLLHRSTIKEKELCIELDKKSFQPCEKKIFIKKINQKSDIFKKKNLLKYYQTSFFIEKYVNFFKIVPFKKHNASLSV